MIRKNARRLGALCAAAVLLASSAAAQSGASCSASYSILNSWPGNFQAAVTIRNMGTTAMSDWTLAWTFGGNQMVTQLWNGSVTQTGPAVTVRNLSYNGSIPAGATYSGIGFLASVTGANAVPLLTCQAGGTQTPDFSLTAAPATLTVNRGTSGSSAIAVVPTGGFTGAVAFTAGALPAGVTATFAPASSATGTALTLAASSAATLGPAIVIVTGASGALSRSVPINLTVNPAPAGDFSLSAAPALLTVNQGASATSTVAITRTGSFAGSVTFSASGLPAGVTASFNPASTTGTSSVVTFMASPTAAAGAATVNIAGVSGALSHNATVSLTVSGGQQNVYTQRFIDLWHDLHNSANGYFSPEGVPYHSVETLIVEAPDYGHETTSETYSYWVWLEAMWGNVSGDWTPLQTAWNSLEANLIPASLDQPTNSAYNASQPATFAPELDLPSDYPSPLNSGVTVGTDPLAGELSGAYGTPMIYGMHWIIDADNFYGYGKRGDGVSRPSYINTFQRGPQESVWETIPQPSYETFQPGWGGPNGYLPLFILDSSYARQWRYTNAPDADARTVQAMYWAKVFADAKGGVPAVNTLTAKAAKLGDYLRYALFDKYFKTMGCTSVNCPAGNGYNSAHYLLSWYYAWGGAADSSAGWAWRIGSSASHFGYQNPVAAWALSSFAALKPASPNGARDWGASLSRQIEFYRWLQAAEGGIAGGATNSWQGRYLAPPAGDTTFYGMAYDFQPVFHDPPSNEWFGFQAWSMERVAEYYYVSGDAKAKLILDGWVNWAMANTTLNGDGTYAIPATLGWSGQPSLNWNATTQNWTAGDPTFNSGLHVAVLETTTDVGVAAAFAKTLIYYSAGTKKWATQHVASQTMAKELLDRMWTLFRDPIGVSSPETRRDYSRFSGPVFVPPNFTGTMPNGDPINSSSTFLSMRSKYRSDPQFQKVQTYLNGGPAPTFNYHRFWAQVDVALANAEYGRLFQ